MNNSGIFVAINNSLYKLAIKQLVLEFNISEKISYIGSLQDCLNGTCKPKYLILDALTIPTPVKFSLEKIGTKNPNCLLLILNAEHFDQSAEPYAHALIKSTDSDSIVHSKFKSFFSASLKDDTQENTDNTISEREKEVVQLVAQGKTNKEISDLLYISPHTVIAHRKNITSKLGIKTIAGLAVYAVLNGLINPEEMNK